MGFSEGCGGFEFGVLHWAELAKPERERERWRQKWDFQQRKNRAYLFKRERLESKLVF